MYADPEIKELALLQSKTNKDLVIRDLNLSPTLFVAGLAYAPKGPASNQRCATLRSTALEGGPRCGRTQQLNLKTKI